LGEKKKALWKDQIGVKHPLLLKGERKIFTTPIILVKYEPAH